MQNFKITNSDIEQAVQTVTEFLQKHKIDRKDILRLTLALEDTLLNYRDGFGENTRCRLKCIHRFGRTSVELSVNAASCNIFLSEGEDEFSRILLSGVGMAPVWQYKDGQNVIVFTPPKKKPSQMVFIAASVLLALICGVLSGFLPADVRTLITDTILLPISDAVLGFLNSVAGITVFLSVLWGICSIGDMTTLTVIGKKMISRMFLMMALLPSLFSLAVLPLFNFSHGSAAGSVNVTEPFSMVLGIIPANLLTPFIDGNFLQIVFLAAAFGIALLILGAKASLVSSFAEQANMLVRLVLEAVCSFVPLVIFISLYTIIVSGSYSLLFDAYKAPLLILGGCILAMAVYSAAVCISQKVGPVTFLRKMMPAFLIALTTASSSAAMSVMMNTSELKFGIDKKIVNFGVPLGRIIFGIGAVIEFISLGFCMAEIYSVSVTPVWIVMTVFTSVLLKIATPPIPGGSMAICTILFTQLGLPLDGLAVAVAIDAVADFVITATDIFCLQCELVLTSSKLNMLNQSRLRSLS